jgi:acyl-coenzyme A synthetase/AMP-(fatty) acid ligase
MLYVFDRRAAAISVDGRLVSTIEVEASLFEHPAVRQAAVFGEPDGSGGQAVAAAVALADPGILPELAGFLAGCLAAEQIPSRWYLVESMPRSANGKVLKHVLCEQLMRQP